MSSPITKPTTPAASYVADLIAAAPPLTSQQANIVATVVGGRRV